MTRFQEAKLAEYLKNPKYCECGCGEIVMHNFNYKGFQISKYIPGHYKYTHLIGKKRSKETKLKISKANKGNIPWNKGLIKNEEN